eukprot:12475800-Heterocapsa_arctica.AAC.1
MKRSLQAILAGSVVSVIASTVQHSIHGLRVHPSSATGSRWPTASGPSASPPLAAHHGSPGPGRRR